jgi:hypothetical protein
LSFSRPDGSRADIEVLTLPVLLQAATEKASSHLQGTKKEHGNLCNSPI